MNNEQQERIEMLLAMITTITGISREEAQSLLEPTVVYENILAGNEYILYESPSATLMEVVDEVAQRGSVQLTEKITPETVENLNRWMADNQIYEAAELVEKMNKEKAAPKEKAWIVALLREQLQSFPGELQEKVSTWLMSTQKLTEHLLSQWSGHLGVAEPVISGTRGMSFVQSVSARPVVYGAGNGLYRFSLAQSAHLRFSMSLPSDTIKPLCLVILCLESEHLSQVYPLSPLGKKNLRVRKTIELPAGEYVMCVPGLQMDLEEDGSADA